MDIDTVSPPFRLVDGGGPILATAIHAGHELRPDVAARMRLGDSERRREEDPYTDRLTAPFATRVVADRSRFEVDLNRPRDTAVYLTPDEAWGLQVWDEPLPPALVAESRAIHADFYRSVESLLDRFAAAGPFLVLDIHSYNHRRLGPDAVPDPAEESPDINLGTGSLALAQWRPLVDRFASDLLDGAPPETSYGENVRFQGGFLSQWVNRRYADRGCALALEFKKTFMDEWTDELDESSLDRLREALAGTIPGATEELQRLR